MYGWTRFPGYPYGVLLYSIIVTKLHVHPTVYIAWIDDDVTRVYCNNNYPIFNVNTKTVIFG